MSTQTAKVNLKFKFIRALVHDNSKFINKFRRQLERSFECSFVGEEWQFHNFATIFEIVSLISRRVVLILQRMKSIVIVENDTKVERLSKI